MGKKYLLILLIVLFISDFIFFSGCGENSVQSVISRDLGGKVFGIFSVPQSNVIVKVKDKSTKTGQDGSFFLSQVTTPYSITVLDSVNKLAMEIISSQFQNFYPQNLAIQTYTSLPNYNPTTINVAYPSGMLQSSGRLLFSDRNDINGYGYPGANGGTINFNLGVNQTVEGVVVALFYTQNTNGNIISYDQYAYRENIRIPSGGIVNVNFLESDFNLIKDTIYNIIYNPLPSHNVIKRFLFLSLSYRRTVDYLDAITFEDFNSNNFNIVVPVNLIKLRYPVIGFVSQDMNTNSQCRDLVPVNGNLTHNSITEPVLIYPQDNSVVDTNALLQFSATSPIPGDEFYIIYLGDTLTNNKYTIITDENYYKISGLNKLGLENIAGKTFTWNVERVKGQLLFYIDEFSSNLFVTRTSSPYRKFSVKQ